MPRLIRHYITQVCIGFGLLAAFVVLLLWGDVAGLRHLAGSVQGGALAVFLLWFFNGIVFSGAQFAVTVLLMAEKDEPPAGGKGARAGLVPIPVRIDDRRP